MGSNRTKKVWFDTIFRRKNWQMRDRLFANQRALEPWNAHAEALGLDVAQYEACLNSGKYKNAVSADLAEASKAGATGTPSFVVGLVDDKDPSKVRGLKFIRGAQAFAAFKQSLDEALASVAKENQQKTESSKVATSRQTPATVGVDASHVERGAQIYFFVLPMALPNSELR